MKSNSHPKLFSCEWICRVATGLFILLVVLALGLTLGVNHWAGLALLTVTLVATVVISKRCAFWLPRKPAKRPRVLMLHSVSESIANPIAPNNSIRPQALRQLIQDLLDSGYTFMTLREAFDGAQTEKRVIVLTFDDGYVDNYTDLFPILKAFQIKGTIFVTDKRGEGFMTDAQLLEMQQSGLVEFGGHTQHHVHLAALNDEVSRHEIAANRQTLTTLLGEAPVSFSYPHGDYGLRDRDATEAAGYTLAVTTKKKYFTPDLLQIERQIIPRDTPRFTAYLIATRGKARI